MLFRLFNILTSYESCINKILVEKLNIFITVYINNILIYIKDLNQAYTNIIL